MADQPMSALGARKHHAMKVFRSSVQILSPYLDDPSVQEVMVNRANEVWVERRGQIERIELKLSENEIAGAIKSLAAANGKDAAPILDMRLPGFRIAAVQEPFSTRGSAISVRRHMHGVKSLAEYERDGGFDLFDWVDPQEVARPTDAEVAQGGAHVTKLLQWIVQQRKNLIVVGGTSSGKTTLLNGLLANIQADQRVLTIEDTAELQILAPNAVCLEADEKAGIPIRALVKLALRMRPDRIIVGEVRGGEAYDLLDAMNTGHPGSACSLHADSPSQGLSRLETLIGMHPDASNIPHRVIQKKIGEAIDFVIFCSRRGSRRGLEQILQLNGTDEHGYQTNLIFNARRHKDT